MDQWLTSSLNDIQKQPVETTLVDFIQKKGKMIRQFFVKLKLIYSIHW